MKKFSSLLLAAWFAAGIFLVPAEAEACFRCKGKVLRGAKRVVTAPVRFVRRGLRR